jgi:hypothetical protein
MKTIKRAIDPLGIMNPGKVRDHVVDSVLKAGTLAQRNEFSSYTQMTKTTYLTPKGESVSAADPIVI